MDKAENVHFSVAFVLCDMQMQLSSTPSKGQGHLGILPKVTWNIFKYFLSETTRAVALLATILALLPYVYKR